MNIDNKTLEEQDKWFEDVQAMVGYEVALYCFCVCNNVEYRVGVESDSWQSYYFSMYQNSDGVVKDFAYGETDVSSAVRASTDGRELWATVWGVGDDEHPYTESDYRRLDELFRTYSSRLQRQGGMDAQQEDTLRACSRMRLLADKSLARGDKESVSIASTLNKMIQDNLASESLRKKDEKQADEIRVDTLIDALERAGMVSKGKILGVEELQEALLRRLGALGGQPSHIFPYTLDAADQMILAIANTIRKNNDEAELTELDENMRFDPTAAGEFTAEPSDEENAFFQAMGYLRRKEDDS